LENSDGLLSTLSGVAKIQPRAGIHIGFTMANRLASAVGQKGQLENIKSSPFRLLAVKGLMGGAEFFERPKRRDRLGTSRSTSR